jgi:hypothetical protein
MKRAIYCGLISAVVGFVVAVWVGSVSPASAPRWMSTRIAYILCPPGIIAGITMTDPDPESIWLLFGPLNALIYGAVAFTLWLLLVGDDDNSAVSKKEGSDRTLDL